MAKQDAAILEELDQAAAIANTADQRGKVMKALTHTPGLDEPENAAIAADVLEKLLPDKEVIVLPKVKRVAGGPVYRFIKRTFDIMSCSAALIILAIPMGIIALKIKAQDKGPAIYTQTRVGMDGKLIPIYKFRSMYMNAEIGGAQWTTEADPRVTPFGRTLRRTRLDELPQFFSVVKGDLSLIGPRPERPAFSEVFEERLVGWNQRTLIKPGITGLAQVSGGYDLLPKDKIQYDIYYIENRSLRLDWSLIWKTIRTMLTGDGAR